MPDFGRRRFLGGAGLLAGAAAGCRPHRDPYTADKPAVPRQRGLRVGSEKFVLTTCALCPAGCGLRVRVVDGRAVKVEGNGDSPVNHGAVCARGQAGLQLLYHPDRLGGPMRRVGRRGANRWRAISWDEAIAHLASELGKLRVAGEPQSLVLVDGETAGVSHALWARFLDVFGSPNHIGHGATGFAALAGAARRLARKASLPGYDFEHSRFVLLMGTGPLESSPQFIHLARALAGGAKPRLLCASPRLPPAAVVVDEWLSLAPGASAAFLLGILHVLLRDGLGDESAVESANGFAAWTDSDGIGQSGLRATVMADFAPELTESWTGVAAAKVEQVARELVAIRPSVVVADEGMCDPATASAILLVNAVLGSLQAPGGMQFDDGAARSLDLGQVERDNRANAGLAAPPIDGRESGNRGVEGSRMLALPQAILAATPYPVKAVLLSYSNPVGSKPTPRRWQEALEKVPFVASFSPFVDESARLADLLLPDHTFFERWDVVAPGRGASVLSLRQPVVRPLANTRQTGDVIVGLARALGAPIAEAFPWTDSHQAVLAALDRQDGGAEAVLGELESSGVWRAPERSSAAPRAGDKPTKDHGDSARPRLFDVRGSLPVAMAPSADSPILFPFVVLPFRGTGYAEGGMRGLAWLRELPQGSENPWLDWLEIAVEDARRLGIAEGDALLVESPEATIEARALISHTLRQGVLGLPLGGGSDSAGQPVPGALGLLTSLTDPASGYWLACATRARVRKVA